MEFSGVELGGLPYLLNPDSLLSNLLRIFNCKDSPFDHSFDF